MRLPSILVALLFCLFPRPSGGEIFSAAPSNSSLPVKQMDSLQLLDREGHPLRSFLSKQETYARTMSLSEISPWLIMAAIATEDRRFYRHHGVDIWAILRASWQNMKGRSVVSGASTITQQVVRALHPRPKTWRGKWAEIRDAFLLERHYTKEQILELYFNILEFGYQIQGVESAAQFYFGVSAENLSLGQSALLVGLVQAPARLNPLENPSGALKRRERVLQAMFRNHFVTQEQYELAMREPLEVQRGSRPFSAPHFSQLIYRNQPPKGQIQTTLDKDLQVYAEKAVRAHLAQLIDQHVTNAAVIVLDNLSGDVLAYVGSADFFDKLHAGQVDGIQALRQPGSALKPFMYALALQNDLTAASLLEDEDTFFEGGFRPRNYDKTFHGRISVRQALANSYNVPVIKAVEPLGAGRILESLHAFGFDSLQKTADFYGLGLALGGGEVSLLELANAYASLARGGVLQPVRAATYPQILLTQKAGRILPKDIAYIITDILSDNAARADAFGVNSSLAFPFSAAAKTGTSKDYKDNFAIAYTPRLTVAVWAGNFDASPMQKVSGITGAGPILHDVMMVANEKYPSGEFNRPNSVQSALICSESGLLAGENCSHTREEIFTSGTVPQQYCDGKHHAQMQKLEIIFPVKGDIYTYDPALPSATQVLHMQVSGATTFCKWKLNNKILATDGTDFWWPLERGKFNLEVTCGKEHAQTFFTVL